MRTIISLAAAGLLTASVLPELCMAQAQGLPSPQIVVPPPPTQALPPAPPISMTPAVLTRPPVRLNGPADLQRLRETNFKHYLRARTILAAANELCQPGPAHRYRTRFAADHPDCRSMMWYASNPPKKLLSFRLDDVDYIAMVSVTVRGAEPMGLQDVATLKPAEPAEGH